MLVFFGTNKFYQPQNKEVVIMAICETCKNTGKCFPCEGTGSFGGEECGACRGTGECNDCGGTGEKD